MRLQFGAVNMAARRVCCVGSMVLASIVPASACTVCDSGTGRQVRAGIFGDEFWTTLVGVIAPFPVLLTVIAAYHYGIPDWWARWSRGAHSLDANPEESTATSPL